MLKHGPPQFEKSRPRSLPGSRSSVSTATAPRLNSSCACEVTAPRSNSMCPCGTVSCTAILPATSICWSTAGPPLPM